MDDALSVLEQTIAGAGAEALPVLYGRLAMLQARILGRLAQPHPQPRADGASFLSVQDVAARLSVPASKVYELARQKVGGLPFVRIGKYLRLSPEALQTWIADPQRAQLDTGAVVSHHPAPATLKSKRIA